MDKFPDKREDRDNAGIPQQQDEALYRAEVAESAHQSLSRRRFLRRSIFVGCGVAIAAGTVSTLAILYPDLTGQFGSIIDLGDKADFPSATPDKFKLNQAGVFYQAAANMYLVHLDKKTSYLLTGSPLENQLAEELFVSDADGSYWLALYKRCTHLGTPVAFRDECVSFKCPSHGAHYHCDGEYLDGPAPRSMDRFPLSFQHGHIFADTSRLTSVARPGDIPRVLPLPLSICIG